MGTLEYPAGNRARRSLDAGQNAYVQLTEEPAVELGLRDEDTRRDSWNEVVFLSVEQALALLGWLKEQEAELRRLAE